MKKINSILTLLIATAVVFGFIGWHVGRSNVEKLEAKYAEAKDLADRRLAMSRGVLAVGHVSLEALRNQDKEEAIRAIEGLTFSHLIFLLQDDKWNQHDYVREFAEWVTEYRSVYRSDPEEWAPVDRVLVDELQKIGIQSQPGEGGNSEHHGAEERPR